MTKNIVLAIAGMIIILVLATTAYVIYRQQNTPEPDPIPVAEITNFDECVAAGNPVMESYPRQCRAGGRTFVEAIAAPDLSDLIVVDSVVPGQTVTSPLVVSGQARGNWYFEATFPVRLYDADHNELYSGPATAQGDWMTTDFVPFTITLNFAPPASGTTGTLVLQKDNPSGLPENEASLEIPVVF